MRRAPMNRRGWADYYIGRYNSDPSNEKALHMATWLLLLIEAFGEERAR